MKNKRNVLHINNMYSSELFEISNTIKQISRDFCAYILINRPEVFEMYDEVFFGFYYLMYAGEVNLIQKKENEMNLEMIRIYYDLIGKYAPESEYFRTIHNVERLFREYEMILRRYMHE